MTSRLCAGGSWRCSAPPWLFRRQVPQSLLSFEMLDIRPLSLVAHVCGPCYHRSTDTRGVGLEFSTTTLHGAIGGYGLPFQKPWVHLVCIFNWRKKPSTPRRCTIVCARKSTQPDGSRRTGIASPDGSRRTGNAKTRMKILHANVAEVKTPSPNWDEYAARCFHMAALFLLRCSLLVLYGGQ